MVMMQFKHLHTVKVPAWILPSAHVQLATYAYRSLYYIVSSARAVKQWFEYAPKAGEPQLEKEKGRQQEWFIVNYSIPSGYIYSSLPETYCIHRCAHKHPNTGARSSETEWEADKSITSHQRGRRWENWDQLSSYCLNLIDTTMKLFRQIGG